MIQESIVFLGTDKMEETHNFMTEFLNLSLYKDQGLCRIYDLTENSKIGFCQHMAITNQDKSPIITLIVEDVDKYYQGLIKKGLDIKEKPQINEYFKIYHFFIKDPNGYTIEIQKFL